MANRSFEFKIGADTSDFIKNMDKADKAVDKFDKQAQKLEKGLKIDFDESRFVQSQKLMQQALEQTEKNADACRQELKFLEESGQANTQAYDEIQNKLAQVENKAAILKQRLKEINSLKFTTLANNITKVGKGLTSLATSMRAVSVVSAAAVASLSKIAKETISTGDEIATLATKYNVSSTEIQKWQYIAMQSDVEKTSLYKGLQKLNATVADLAKGEINNASQALLDLGLDANTSFETLISRLSSLDSETDKLYYSSQIFGDKLGADIIPLLDQGSEAINEYIKEFEEVGYLSEDAVAELSRVDNVLNKTKQSFKESALALGEALLPVVERFANYLEQSVVPKLNNLIDKFDKLSDSTKETAMKVLVLIPVITALTAVIGKLFTGIANIIRILPNLKAILDVLSAHPVIRIISIVATLLAILYTANENFRESVNRLVSLLGRLLEPILSRITDMLAFVFKILQPIINLIGNELARALNVVSTILQPIVDMLTWIMDAIDKIDSGLMGLVGKGWLWGTDEDTGSSSKTSVSTYTPSSIEYPTVSNPTYDTSTTSNYTTDNSTVVNNITIEANEYTTAEDVARILSLKLQSRR